MAHAPKLKAGSVVLATVGLFGPTPRLASQTTAPAPVVTFEQGDALEEKMQTKEALAVYLQLERAGRKDADLLYRIAMEYSELMPDAASPAEKQRLGGFAVDYAQRAVSADGKSGRAYLALAIAYGRNAFSQDNRTKLAYSRLVRANAETALRLDPQLDYAYYILGAWNYEIANMSFLRRELATVIYGGLPDASNAKAVEYLQKAIELAPQRVSHHIELGRTYAVMGQPDLARQELEKGLALPTRAKDDEEMKRIGRVVLKTLPQKK